MFYARINKVKVFNNREGFFGLFNKAEVKIYGLAGRTEYVLKAQDLANKLGGALSEDDKLAEAEKELAAAIEAEAENMRFIQMLPIKGVKDNQILTFGETGIQLYSSREIPEELSMHIWVVELDKDIRDVAIDIQEIIASTEFKTLSAAVLAALAFSNPIALAGIPLCAYVFNKILKKQSANKNDLIGYWHTTLNRNEHYPHGLRNKENEKDSTNNMTLDYTLFAVEDEAVNVIQSAGY